MAGFESIHEQDSSPKRFCLAKAGVRQYRCGHVTRHIHRIVAGIVPWVAAAACATTPRPMTTDARASSDRAPYTAADVRFMSEMIHHHAQALVMARWAPTHGASSTIRTLAERNTVSQRDEITFMERWLEERNEPVPDTEASHAALGHGKLMPGMLTADQLAQLDRARGPDFDRLFLTFMIQHHEGAITMVEELLGARGAAQDETIFQFAADVHADQLAEIDRMSRILATLSAVGKR